MTGRTKGRTACLHAIPWLLGVVAVVACTSRPVPAWRESLSRAVAAPDAPRDQMLDGATRAYLVGEEDGATLAVVGGRRAKVRGDRVEWSSDRLAEAIVHVGRNAHGWVFVGADGVVARSTSFLGALERAGDVPYPFSTAARPSHFFQPRAPLVLGAGEGERLWAVPDEGAPAALNDAPLPVVDDFLVVDAQTRVAVLPNGQVARTVDGGHVWAAIDTGDLLADGVEQRGDEVFLQLRSQHTLPGLHVQSVLLGVDGRLGSARRRDDRETDVDLNTSGPDLPAWARALVAEETVGRGMLAATHTPYAWENGDVLLAAREGAPLLRVDPVAWRVVARFEGPSRGACLPLSDHLLCVDHGSLDAPRNLLREVLPEGAMGQPRTMQLPPAYSMDQPWVGGDDVLLWGQRCPGEAANDEAGAAWVCVTRGLSFDGQQSVAIGRRHVAGVHHGQALLVPRVGSTSEGVAVLDVGTGAIRAVSLPDTYLQDGQVNVRWLPDGTLLARQAEAEGGHVLLVTPDGERREASRPEGALSMDFLDARRGVAVAATTFALWKTNDGGRSWHRAPAPSNSTPEARQHHNPGTLWCSARVCLAFGSWVVRAWDDRPADGQTLAATSAPRSIPISEPSIDAWACEDARAGRGAALPRRQGEVVAIGAGYLAWTSPGDRWSWADGTVSRAAQTSGPLPEALRQPADRARSVGVIVAASERALVLDRCAPAPRSGDDASGGSWRCALWWVRAGSSPVPIGEHAPPSGEDGSSTDRPEAMAWVRDEEGAVLWRAGSTLDRTVYSGARLGAGGVQPLQEVALNGTPHSRLLALARVDGRWGAMFALDYVDAPTFFPMEGTDRLPVQTPSADSASAPCHGAADAAVDVMVRNAQPGLTHDEDDGAIVTVNLERSGEAWCARSAGYSLANPAGSRATATHGRVASTDDGAMRGRRAGPGGVFTQTCR